MNDEPPYREPATVVAGDTVRWRKCLPQYPTADGWTLKYRLINAQNHYDIVAFSAGDHEYEIDVLASTTAAWAPGTYAWQAYVDNGSDRFTVGQGTLRVLPNLAGQTAGYDARSHARRALEAIEAVLERRASEAHLEYEIAGRRLRFIPVAELLALRDRYRMEVRAEEDAERAAAGLAPRNKIRVRF